MPVKEGKALVEAPSGDVFYNPTQVFNRDFSILATATFLNMLETENTARVNQRREESMDGVERKPYRVLEALAASGLRSIRMMRELPPELPVHFVVNDISEVAVETIKHNIENNKEEGMELHTAEASHRDALELMYRVYGTPQEKHFDVIDLDPYGSPAMFIPAALVAVKNGGMLSVTATDTRVLCGSQQDVCYGRYGGISIHNDLDKEAALRLIIKSIVDQACHIRLVATPLVSFFHAHYMRVFFRVTSASKSINRAGASMGIVHSCPHCASFYPCSILTIQKKKSKKGNDVEIIDGSKGPNIPTPAYDNECSINKSMGEHKMERNMVRCPLCGGKLNIAGPMWLGPLHDTNFVRAMKEMIERLKSSAVLASYNQISALLDYQEQESLDGNIPFFYTLSHLSRISHSSSPSLKRMVSLIHSAGFRVSVSHTVSEAIRTDAPPEFIASIMRMWTKISHIITKDIPRPLETNSPSARYLEGPSTKITEDELKKFLIEYKILNEDTPLDTIGSELINSITKGEGPLVSLFSDIPEGFIKDRFFVGKTHLFLPNPEPNWGPKRAAPLKSESKK